MTDLIHPDPGGQIAEPGAYRMDMDRYHDAHVCIGPSVSSGGLAEVCGDRTKKYFGPNTARFWAHYPLNPNYFPKKTSNEMDFGRAAHALLLGDEDFEAGYAIRPTEYKDYRTDEAKKWRSEVRSAGKTAVTPEDMVHIQHMSESLHRAKLPDIMFEGLPEVSLLWIDREGFWRKARPDCLPFTGEIPDLKTVTSASTDFVDRQTVKLGYDLKLANCAEGMQAVLGRTPSHAVLIFIEKTPPYMCNIRPISEDAMYWARLENRRSANALGECFKTGDWGEEPGNLSEFNLPTWLHDRLSAEQSDGRLPNDDDEDEEGGE